MQGDYYGRKCKLEIEEDPGKFIETEPKIKAGKITVLPLQPKSKMASSKSFSVKERGIIRGGIKKCIDCSNTYGREQAEFKERVQSHIQRIKEHGYNFKRNLKFLTGAIAQGNVHQLKYLLIN